MVLYKTLIFECHARCRCCQMQSCQCRPRSTPSPPYLSLGSILILVRASRRLASLKLIKIPPTNSQTTLVVVHALTEALDVVCARTGLGHLSGRRVGRLVLCAELGGLGRGFGGGGGAATEPAADCVADGGAYCDTAMSVLASDSYNALCTSHFNSQCCGNAG
jgi:hypothetical protein